MCVGHGGRCFVGGALWDVVGWIVVFEENALVETARVTFSDGKYNLPFDTL